MRTFLRSALVFLVGIGMWGVASSVLAMNKPASCSPTNWPTDDFSNSIGTGSLVPEHMHGAAAVIGRSPIEIHARFASVVEQNFLSGSNHLVDRLSDRELHDLARLYYVANAGKSARLLDIIASKADHHALA
jgi:hypothetical protein